MQHDIHLFLNTLSVHVSIDIQHILFPLQNKQMTLQQARAATFKYLAHTYLHLHEKVFV